jgi:hypothetical protein
MAENPVVYAAILARRASSCRSAGPDQVPGPRLLNEEHLDPVRTGHRLASDPSQRESHQHLQPHRPHTLLAGGMPISDYDSHGSPAASTKTSLQQRLSAQV